MLKLAKIFLLIIVCGLLLPILPSSAAGEAVMILTSPKTDYYVGETVYIKIEVKTNGETLNVARAIMDFTGGDVLLVQDFNIGTALPYVSPGKELTNDTDHINVGGFILVDSVSQDFLLGTLVFKANQIGSSDIGKPFLTGSHLISPQQEEKINLIGCQGITINVIAPPPPTNRPPVFDAVSDKSIELGQAVNFQIRATDPDNDMVNFVPAWEIPVDAILENIIQGGLEATAGFRWTPTSSGTYTLKFYATDNHPTDPKTALLTVRVTVNLPPQPINHAPIFQSVANQVINLGQSVNFLVKATDPDDDLVNLTWTIPSGAVFNNVTNDAITVTGNFSWTPAQEGLYTVNFVAIDNSPLGPKSANLAVGIAVSVIPPPANHPPIINSVSEKTLNAGETLTFDVSAYDPDGDNVTLSMQPLDIATFKINQTGKTPSNTFSWTPKNYGIYYVLFDAIDDHPTTPMSKSLAVRITVFGGECPPCGGGTCATCSCQQQTFENLLLDKPLPIITSPTHPSQDVWYPINTPQFQWIVAEPGIGYIFNLDEQPLADPATGYYLTTDQFFSFTEVADGFWYFHLKVQYTNGWGPTAHYQIKIDTVAPEFFKPSIIKDSATSSVQISFSALDRHSGVDFYQLKIDQGNWQMVQSPYTLSVTDLQGKIMTLRAVDRAGNARESYIDLVNMEVLDEEETYNLAKEKIVEVTQTEKVISEIPQTITRVSQLVNDKFLNNPQVEQVSQNIVTPALLAVNGLNLLASLAGLLSYLPFLHLLFLEPLLWLFGRKRKKWGVVYNSLTKVPLDFAIVRLYLKSTDKLIKTKISDRQGRYLFVVDQPDSYYLIVQKPGYIFPTKYLKDIQADRKYLDLYHGEVLEVTEKNNTITVNIPLDPEGKKLVPTRELIRSYFVKLLRLVVSYLGIFLAFAVVIITPTFITIGALILHIIFFIIFRLLIMPHRPRSWGKVIDKSSRKPLVRAVVRLFDSQYNKLLEAQVTDRHGHYGFLAGANIYQLLAEKQGYQRQIIKPVDLTKKEKIVNLDISLSLGNDSVNKNLAAE